MIAAFKEKSIVAFFALVICTVIVHFHIFYEPIKIYNSSNTGLFSYILNSLIAKLHPVFITISYILILFLQSVRLNIILNNYKMYAKPNFAVGFAYIFLSGLLPNAYLFSPAFLVNSIIILLFSVLFKFYNNQKAKNIIFNAGLLAALSTICYYPSIYIVAVSLIALAVLRPFKLDEWFILLFGIITPFYLLFASLYLLDFNFSKIILQKIGFWIYFKLTDNLFLTSLISLCLLFLLSIIYWFPNSNRLIIQIRKNWVVMLSCLISTIFSITIYSKMKALPEVLFLIPMSAFLANFFVYPKKVFWVNAVIFLVAILIVYNNYNIIK